MSNVLESVSALFSGSSLLDGTSESKMREMSSGMAVIKEVKPHPAKSGFPSVKVVFDALNPKQDGHDEFLRTSTANNLNKSLQKLVYLFVHAGNDEATALFKALQSPIELVTGEDGQPIKFQTNDELKELRAEHGETLDWVWETEKKDSARIAVRFTDRQAYCDAFQAAVEALGKQKYYLQIQEPNKDSKFQRISAIKKPIAVS